jgi:hypothetical protein
MILINWAYFVCDGFSAKGSPVARDWWIWVSETLGMMHEYLMNAEWLMLCFC